MLHKYFVIFSVYNFKSRSMACVSLITVSLLLHSPLRVRITHLAEVPSSLASYQHLQNPTFL